MNCQAYCHSYIQCNCQRDSSLRHQFDNLMGKTKIRITIKQNGDKNVGIIQLNIYAIQFIHAYRSMLAYKEFYIMNILLLRFSSNIIYIKYVIDHSLNLSMLLRNITMVQKL